MVREWRGQENTDREERIAAWQEGQQRKADKASPPTKGKGDKDSVDKLGDLGNAAREGTVAGKIPVRDENVPEDEMADLETDHDGNGTYKGTDQDQDLDDIKAYSGSKNCPDVFAFLTNHSFLK